MTDFTRELCGLKMDYSNFQQTFSPLYSNFGLDFGGSTSGVAKLWLHYNRRASHIFSDLCVFSDTKAVIEKKPTAVYFKSNDVDAGLAFYDTDAFVISGKSLKPLGCFCTNGEHILESWIAGSDGSNIFIKGYVSNGDDRDPDKQAPVAFGLRAIKGSLDLGEGKLVIKPDENGEISVAFAMSVLETGLDQLRKKLLAAPLGFEDAERLTESWVCECVGDYTPNGNDASVKKTVINAVCSLLFNLTKAPGNLKNYISAYPNRGQYPTHFTWDSCFQNLAFEMMNPKLAKHSLLQLSENLRTDGKLPQFLCSTWVRPQSAQPALVSWAGIRYIEQTGDMDFAARLLPALELNNGWWLQSRITRFGVISCPDGLETGQDDSPRFDNGATLAADMNSYLLRQLKITAKIAAMLGDSEKENKWLVEAEKLEGAMLATLYDADKNFFFDADPKTGEHIPVVTPCGLLPLWAGISLPEDKAKALIENYLLNEEIFFGEIPFPSVAYNDPTYEHENWWRGPTWMPESWLMLETLKTYGYEKEYDIAVKRLYNVLVKDNILHELFDSKTGEGMGAAEQSWTAAIFIKLNSIVK